MERYSDEAIRIIDELHTERLDYQSEYIPLIDAAPRLDAYEATGVEPENICVDTSETYNLQKAARQLDNRWFSYSNYGCYLANSQGYPYFRVFPSEEQLARVAENPAEYFIIEVFVKS